jgi:arginase
VRIAIIGAPTSAGAFSRGQEDAPAALRDAGLLAALTEAGVDAVDLGDIPRFAWRPDPSSPRAMNAAAVRQAAEAVAEQVRAARAAGRLPLVIGGDCTIELGTVLGFADLAAPPGLVYFDPHPDLNTPDSVTDGALDWMGVAHLLDLPGAVDDLAGVGPRRPLLDSRSLVLLGASDTRSRPGERAVVEQLGLVLVSEADLSRNPGPVAADAVRRLTDTRKLYLVHFDVDAVDFADAPLAENTDRNVGLTLDAALEALAAVLRVPGLAALTVTELNPHHAAAVPGLLERFTYGLAAAIAE